ncbi:MAG: nucleotidyl transferase AbiEii/AbiGii toxin family protein [Polyangiaceae bacterium]
MRSDILEPEQRAALLALKPAAQHGYYLAGGTALCLHLAHRRSVDLDLFRTDPFDADTMVSDLTADGVQLSSVRTSRATVHGEVRGIPTSLLCFPYPLLEAPEVLDEGVPVASVRDIAAMKVEAIASRGARKDFYDLYFICQSGLSLEQVLAIFGSRFASAHPDVYHRLRALTYFDDAEREPEPDLLRSATWEAVRDFFRGEVRRIWQAP